MSEKLYQVKVQTWKDGVAVNFTDDKIVSLREAIKIAKQFQHSMCVIVGLKVKTQCVEIPPTPKTPVVRKYSVKIVVSSTFGDETFIQTTKGGYSYQEALDVARNEREDAIFDGKNLTAQPFAIRL